MYALFYEKNDYVTGYILRVGNPAEIRYQLAHINDWLCLVNMGRTMGPRSDQPQLNKLEKFLSSCNDRKTMERFKIKLSTGESGCVMCAETEEELENMRKYILSAPTFGKTEQQKLNGLFDRLLAHLRSTDDYHDLYLKVMNRQHINMGIARDDYLD